MIMHISIHTSLLLYYMLRLCIIPVYTFFRAFLGIVACVYELWRFSML